MEKFNELYEALKGHDVRLRIRLSGDKGYVQGSSSDEDFAIRVLAALSAGMRVTKISLCDETNVHAPLKFLEGDLTVRDWRPATQKP